MRIVSETLDDLQFRVLKQLLERPHHVIQATRGHARELSGACLVLKNPRARLGRGIRQGRLFSSLGEVLWYLAGTDDLEFIAYYIAKYREESSDGKTVRGAYGKRLFHNGQLYKVIALLREKSTSRRAVVQLFRQTDLRNRTEVPCTISIQLLVRNSKLDMIASMRSNDAFMGLPHDIFAFTMIQEIVARELGIGVGRYTHFVGSLHLYQNDEKKARAFVRDGYQRRQEMPAMPVGSPRPAIRILLDAEKSIREHAKIPDKLASIESYWMDFMLLLLAFSRIKRGDYKGARRLKTKLSTNFYDRYIDLRAPTERTDEPEPTQSALELS
nr:thymidylate synthase [Stenotrophomonas rhizophila]